MLEFIMLYITDFSSTEVSSFLALFAFSASTFFRWFTGSLCVLSEHVGSEISLNYLTIECFLFELALLSFLFFANQLPFVHYCIIFL